MVTGHKSPQPAVEGCPNRILPLTFQGSSYKSFPTPMVPLRNNIERKFMDQTHLLKIARELNLTPQQVQATADLLNEGATVPFIARYRKEATGSLDEVAVTAVRDRMTQLQELDKRREAILKSLGRTRTAYR